MPELEVTTFEEVVDRLSNGLHDAELIRFEIDYTRRELRLELDVWIVRPRRAPS